jgi:hypothetical protein
VINGKVSAVTGNTLNLLIVKNAFLEAFPVPFQFTPLKGRAYPLLLIKETPVHHLSIVLNGGQRLTSHVSVVRTFGTSGGVN